MLRLIRCSLLVCLLLGLSSCGFRLRGDFSLPDSIKTVQLNSTSHNTALKRSVEKRLKDYQLQVVEGNQDGSAPDLVLTILPDELDRRLLSLFTTGQVAEYELVYSVAYHLQFVQTTASGERIVGEAQTVEFDVTRDYQDDPDAVLAKSRELDLVLGEMRQQAAERIIRQIYTSYVNQQSHATN